MTPSVVLARVDALRTLDGHDHEAACAGAAELRDEVLQEIAGGNPASIALARAAMLTIEEDIGGC